MSRIDTLTARLDSLLNESNGEEDEKPREGNEDDEDDWENMDEEVSDYISLLDSRTKIQTSKEPMFPSDFSENGTQFDLKDWPKETGNKSKSTKNENTRGERVFLGGRQLELKSSSELAIQTVADLTKKVRHLNAQLAASQNKLNIAQSKLVALQEHQCKQETKPKEVTEESENKVVVLEKQVKDLNEKLSTANTRLFEARNQIQLQKHEMKVLQKAIASEIGDNVSVQSLTSEGWRGRAQQIMSLQQKVNELTEKLSQTGIPLAEKSSTAMLVLERAQDKERISSLTSELEETKSCLNEMKNKNDQAKARIKVLANELNSVKAKYEAQSMKNEEDVKLINTLTTRLTSVSQKCHDRERSLASDYEDKLSTLNTDYQQEKLKADQLKKIVIDRDSKIEKLNAQINELRQLQKDHEDRPPSSWSTFQDRPPSRRSSVAGNNLPTTELERMRLMELVTVLNKRLDEDRKTLDRVQEELRTEKQRSVRLENKCSRLELEKVGRPGSYRRSASSARSSTADLSKAELAAAKDRCALLEEKILALESRLDRLRKEKEEDSRIYVRMIEETRQAMREHIRKSNISSNMSLP